MKQGFSFWSRFGILFTSLRTASDAFASIARGPALRVRPWRASSTRPTDTRKALRRPRSRADRGSAHRGPGTLLRVLQVPRATAARARRGRCAQATRGTRDGAPRGNKRSVICHGSKGIRDVETTCPCAGRPGTPQSWFRHVGQRSSHHAPDSVARGPRTQDLCVSGTASGRQPQAAEP